MQDSAREEDLHQGSDMEGVEKTRTTARGGSSRAKPAKVAKTAQPKQPVRRSERRQGGTPHLILLNDVTVCISDLVSQAADPSVVMQEASLDERLHQHAAGPAQGLIAISC